MALKPLKIDATWYIIDTDLRLIVSTADGPADKPWIIREKAQKIAEAYAQKTGHSVVVMRPEAYF